MDEFFHVPSSDAAINPECLSAEEKLRAIEERYHSLFAHMMDGFAFCKMIFNQKNMPLTLSILKLMIILKK